MNQERPPLALTPEEIAYAANQQAAVRAEMIQATNVGLTCQIYTMLLEKWFLQHSASEGYEDIRYPKPTANDLRWLAKIAAHYAPFALEAAGLIKIKDAKLEALNGIADDNLLEFSNLMTIADRKESNVSIEQER